MTKIYVGVKQVQAWEQEKDGRPGYAVKYPDGYISWSPKDVFEAAYFPISDTVFPQDLDKPLPGALVEAFIRKVEKGEIDVPEADSALWTKPAMPCVTITVAGGGSFLVRPRAVFKDDRCRPQLEQFARERVEDMLRCLLTLARNGLK